MTIQSIKITNLYGNNYEWQLNPDVNILVGANGTCKSKILNLLKLRIEENYYDIVSQFAGEEPPLIEIKSIDSEYHCLTNKEEHKYTYIKNKQEFNCLINSIIPNKPKYTYSLGEQTLYNILCGACISPALTMGVTEKDYNPQLIYFLDNPENNLYIDLQHNLINWIRELNPTCQVIMTTHSPSIWYRYWIEEITRIEDIKI